MQSAIGNEVNGLHNHRSAILLLLSLAAMPLAAGVSNITKHIYDATLTGAVDRADNGDVLNVSTGVYVPIVIISKNLAIRGGYNIECDTLLLSQHSIIRPLSGMGISFWPSPSTGELCNFVVENATMSALYFANQASWLISNCLVRNSSSADFGGGLDIRSSSHVVLENTQVYNNHAVERGGGANVDYTSSLAIGRNSSVFYNDAPMGGGVTVRNGSTLLLRDEAAMYGNIALTGGAVHATSGAQVTVDTGGIIGDATIRNAATNGDGGGVYAESGATVKLEPNGRIAGNFASGSGGGVSLSNATLRMNNASMGRGIVAGTIWTNVAGFRGGSVYAGYGSTVVIDSNSVVSGESGAEGGGIAAKYSSVTVRHSEVSRSRAGTDGAGICSLFNGSLTLDSVVISDNTCDDYGGGVFVIENSQWQATNVLFANNVASAGGGFLVWSMEPMGRVLLENVVISNNTATDGGGGGLTASTNEVVVRNAQIVDNRAGWSGGLQIGDGEVLLEHVRVANNSARGYSGGGIGQGTGGGGIGVLGGSLVMRDCSVVSNEGDSDGDGWGFGGGLYVASTYNVSLVIEADTDMFALEGNHADRGGAIYLEGCVTATVAAASGFTVSCSGNTASNGAGIFLGYTAFAASGVLLETCGALAIANNHAVADGGGIYADASFCNLLASNGYAPSVIGNTAGNNGGGAALVNSATLTAVNCQFENNASTNGGGAVHVASGMATIGADFAGLPALAEPPCIFRNNRAGGNGGAVNAGGNTARIAVSDALMVSNQALSGGAAYVMDGQLAMANAVMAHNGGTHAINGFGGGRACLLNCTIADNAGGGVQVMNMLAMTNCIVWGNGGTQVSGGGGSDVSYCDVQGGGMAGTNNIDADPLFADTNALNYQITGGSPCTNTGAPMAGIVTNDCLGIERPQFGGWDMGAYEFVPEPAAALFVIGCSLFAVWRKNVRQV